MRWEPQDITVSKVRYEELDHLEEIFQREFGDEPNMETVRMRLKRMRSFYYLLLPLCRISSWVRERFNVYVIRVQEKFAGFIQLSLAGPKRLHLDFIAIAAAYRRSGIGSYILRSLCNEFVDPKAYEMLLEVRVDNPAHRLYVALGFQEVARILHYERRFEAVDKMKRQDYIVLQEPHGEDEARIDVLCRENTPDGVASILGAEACAPVGGVFKRSLRWLKNLSMRCAERVYVLKEAEEVVAAVRIRSYAQITNHTITLFLQPQYEALRQAILQEIVCRLALDYQTGNLHTTIYDDTADKRRALERCGFTQSEAYILMYRPAADARKMLKAVDNERSE